MCLSQSVGSYEQAGEVPRVEYFCRKAMKTFIEKSQAGILPTVFQGLPSSSLVSLIHRCNKRSDKNKKKR